MSLLELDRALEQLRDAAGRIATNLAELERDPACQLLAVASLDGDTATRWTEAADTIGDLWRGYTCLVTVLEEATRVRGTKDRVSHADESRLIDLLTGPSIEVDSLDVPVHARGLLGSRRFATRCNVDDLLAVMSDSFDRVKAVVAAAATAWDELVPRIATARSALETKLRSAAEFEPGLVRDLESLRSRFDAMAVALTTDPLSVQPDAVAALEADLAALGDALLAASDLRAALDERLEAARRLLAAARDATSAALASCHTASEKIARPKAHGPIRIDTSTDRDLDEIAALADRGQIRDAHRQLDEWTVVLEAARRDNDRAASLNRSLIEERDRLRGRLDAYLAKAHAVDLAEDARITGAYEDAHALLYTAPTDLERARELVERYQQAVSSPRRCEP